MRIGIDATCLPSALAGAGRYIHGIVRGLAQVDRDNEYFIFIKENDATRFHDLPANLHLVRLPVHSRPLRLIWQHALAGAQAQKLGLEVWHGTHYTLPNFSNGLACVATFHDLGVFHHPRLYPFDKRIYFRRVMQQAAARAHHIVSVSAATTHDLQALLTQARTSGHDREQNVTTIFSGVEEKFFQPAAVEEIARVRRERALATPYVLFVGTLEKRKNLVMLLQAFHEFCRRETPRHVLVLAGQNSNGSAEVAATIARLHLQERVRVLGYVAEKDLPALYQGAELFVMPSLYEGFGFPLLEAMAGGVVALAANNSSLRELAAHPQMLCEATPSAWAEKIATLLFEAKLRQELARHGAQHARQFCWRRSAEKLRAVYESAAAERFHRARNGKVSSNTRFSVHDEAQAIPSSRAVSAAIEMESKNSKQGTKNLNTTFAGENTPLTLLKGEIASAFSPFVMKSQDHASSPVAPHSLSLAAAIKKTLAYSDLFDYPLTAKEIHHGLLEHAATPLAVLHELERLCAAGEIATRQNYYCLPGREHGVELRERRRRTSEKILQSYSGVLRLIKNFPFIRTVALSGTLAFQNAKGDDDLDLFVIVERGRLWTVYFSLVLLLKALGRRRAVCLNCLLDTAHLAITDRDFFVAHQIVFLRPLGGVESLRTFQQANAWCAQYLPQMATAPNPFTAAEIEDAARARSRWRKALETVWRWRAFDVIETMIFNRYRRRIRRLTPHLNAQAVVAEAGQIKLFTNNHRFHIQRRLEQRLQKMQEYNNIRQQEAHEPYAAL